MMEILLMKWKKVLGLRLMIKEDMKAIGNKEWNKVKVKWFFQMEMCMKDYGKMINKVDRDIYNLRIKIHMKENFLMIKCMVKEFIYLKVDTFTKGRWKMI